MSTPSRPSTPSGDALDLAGVFVAAATPFDAVTGDLDVMGLRSNLRIWLGTAIRGVLIGGSTGEAALLDATERVQALKAAREVLPSDRLLVAGTGAESTRETVRQTRAAAQAGADVVLVQPPSYYREAMNLVALSDYYARVADASPVPVLLYQPPLKFSTVELPTELIVAFSAHANVIGLKDSRGNLEIQVEILKAARPGFQYLTGAAGRLLMAREVGAVGAILAVANFAPGLACTIDTALRQGRGEEAERAQALLAALGQVIAGDHGVPGVKTALDLIGLKGGPPRSPLQPLDEAGSMAISAALTDAGLLDTPRRPG